METPAVIIGLLFVFSLTAGVVPRSIGLLPKNDTSLSKRLWIAVLFGGVQAVMALIGTLVGSLFMHLFTPVARITVFAVMLIVAIKMFIDSIKIMKGKTFVSFSSDWGFVLLAVLASTNIMLMSLTSQFYLPFGNWFYVIALAAGFAWAIITSSLKIDLKIVRNSSFIEFSASVFLIVIALLYMFTDLVA